MSIFRNEISCHCPGKQFIPTAQEKAVFSERLKFALRKSSFPVKGATDLARFFNLQHSVGNGVSVQTAHKWLNGRAIPKDDKIKTLAAWLHVTEHWLHYGPPPSIEGAEIKQPKSAPSAETLVLARDIDALPDHQRYLVKELVVQFLQKSAA